MRKYSQIDLWESLYSIIRYNISCISTKKIRQNSQNSILTVYVFIYLPCDFSITSVQFEDLSISNFKDFPECVSVVSPYSIWRKFDKHLKVIILPWIKGVPLPLSKILYKSVRAHVTECGH